MELRERLASLGVRPLGRPAPRVAGADRGLIEEVETPFGPCARRMSWGGPAPRARPPGALLAWLTAESRVDEVDGARLVYLDCETTGLSTGPGTVAFVVGVGQTEPGTGALRLEQFVLRDFREEPALLWVVAQRLRPASAVVTYNGRCFDLPLLETRFILARQDGTVGVARQLDLLYPVRRLFRPRLGTCTLTAVEEGVLARRRDRDLPGSMMPSLFFAYLRDGEWAHLEPALAHNRADVTALADLMDALCRHLDARPGSAADARDRWALGRFFEARQCPDRALAEYATISEAEEMGYQAGLRRARLLRRARRPQEAIEVLRALWRWHPHGYSAAIELAKLMEHVTRDIGGALRLVAEALEHLMADPEDLMGSDWREDLERRYARLRRRGRAAYWAKGLGPLGGRYGAGLVGTPL